MLINTENGILKLRSNIFTSKNDLQLILLEDISKFLKYEELYLKLNDRTKIEAINLLIKLNLIYLYIFFIYSLFINELKQIEEFEKKIENVLRIEFNSSVYSLLILDSVDKTNLIIFLINLYNFLSKDVIISLNEGLISLISLISNGSYCLPIGSPIKRAEYLCFSSPMNRFFIDNSIFKNLKYSSLPQTNLTLIEICCI